MSLLDTLVIQEYFQPPILFSDPIKGLLPRREIYVAIRNDRPLGLIDTEFFGDGTENNPYDGSTHPRLDLVLNRFGTISGVSIRLGPGVFQTKGGPGNGITSGAWAIGSNVKIVGAGMHQTTLQLVGVEQKYDSNLMPKTTSTPIIAQAFSTLVDDVEISDLTLDCNGHRQGVFQYGRIVQPTVMVHGIFLSGSNLSFRRVRVINWGTFSPRNGLECFPMAAGASPYNSSHPVFQNGLIEDCIVEQPCRNQGRESTCIVLGGGLEDSNSRKLVYFKNARVRNNYVNGELVNPMYPVHTVTTASYNSGTDRTTLRTFHPYRMRDGDWVHVSRWFKDVMANSQN